MTSLVPVIVFLTLNPYASFLPLSSDTQPLCLVFQIIFLLNNQSSAILTRPLKYICIALILIFIASLASASSLDPIDFFRGAFPYIQAVSSILCGSLLALRQNYKRSILTGVKLFFILTAISFIFQATGLHSVNQLFVNRSLSGIGTETTGKGFVGLFPEQSRVPEQITYALLILLVSNQLGKLNFYIGSALSFLSFSGQFFIQCLVLSLSFVMKYSVNIFSRLKIAKSFFSVVVIGILLFVVVQLLSDLPFLSQFRGFRVLESFLSIGISPLLQDRGIAYKISPLLNSISFLCSSNLFDIRFAGIKSFDFAVSQCNDWLAASLGTLSLIPPTPFSSLAHLVSDSKIFGFLLGLYIIYILLNSWWNDVNPTVDRQDTHSNLHIVPFFILFHFLTRSAMSNPAPWLLLSYYLTIKKVNISLDNSFARPF